MTQLITHAQSTLSAYMYELWWQQGAYFVVFTSCPWGKEGPIRCVFMSVCLQANQPDWTREGKEGVTWQNHSYYEIVGLHFNSTWPCQGHHMPACLPGLLETQSYWTKAAAPQRHTQQLFSVATYHLTTLTAGRATVTLHHWGGATPTAHS